MKLKSEFLKQLIGKEEVDNSDFENLHEIDLGGIELDEEEIINIFDDMEGINRQNITLFKNGTDQFKMLIAKRWPQGCEFEGQDEYKKDEIEKLGKVIDWRINGGIPHNIFQFFEHKEINILNKDLLNIAKIQDALNSLEYDGNLSLILRSRNDTQQLLKNLEKLNDSQIDLKIRDMSVISTEDLNSICQNENIKRIGVGFERAGSGFNIQAERYYYSPDNYRKIREKIDSIISDVNNDSAQVDKFFNIYKKIIEGITYDFDDDTGEPSERKEAHNLEGGLLEGRCVCEGYALALHNVLSCMEIRSKVIAKSIVPFYNTIDDHGGHAWNQVEIDGQWYNCDPTWDYSQIKDGKDIRYCLINDEELSVDHSEYKYYTEIGEYESECKENYDTNKIKEFFNNRKGIEISNESMKSLANGPDSTDIAEEKQIAQQDASKLAEVVREENLQRKEEI